MVLNQKHCEKVDIWAAGVILYYSCTNKYPFNDINESEYVISDKIIKSEPEDIP